MAGTHAAPPSAMRMRRPGWRSRAPLVLAQDLGVRPVVPRPHRFPGQLRVLDLDRPEAHGRERELAPDALLVEVLQPDAEVPGPRRAYRVHEVVQLTVHPLAVDVE